jgi:hypothetical protein
LVGVGGELGEGSVGRGCGVDGVSVRGVGGAPGVGVDNGDVIDVL